MKAGMLTFLSLNICFLYLSVAEYKRVITGLNTSQNVCLKKKKNNNFATKDHIGIWHKHCWRFVTLQYCVKSMSSKADSSVFWIFEFRLVRAQAARI